MSSRSRTLDFGVSSDSVAATDGSSNPTVAETSMASQSDSPFESRQIRFRIDSIHEEADTRPDEAASPPAARRGSKDAAKPEHLVLDNKRAQLSRSRSVFRAVVLGQTLEPDDGAFSGDNTPWRRRSSIAQQTGLPAWVNLALVALCALILTLILAAIPLSDPNGKAETKLLWILFSNPLTYTLLTLVICTLFSGVLQDSKTFEHQGILATLGPPVVVNWVLQVVIMTFLYPFTQTFPAMGLIPLVICVLSTLFTLQVMEVSMWPSYCTFYTFRLKEFRRVVFSIMIYIVALSVWVSFYRVADSTGQFLLPFLLLVLVFAWKKYLLAVTDNFPIEIAMLISGFWLENLDDVFQTLVFPAVEDGFLSFFFLWFRKFLENMAYLIFLTDRWFTFRVWIKDFLKRLFTGRLKDAPAEQVSEDVDLNDRGHGNIKPGYRRRQLQFFMYKVYSQLTSFLFYLAVSPLLRRGPNYEFYPLSEAGAFIEDEEDALSDGRYRDSLIYAGFGVASSVFTGFLAYKVVHGQFLDLARQMKWLYEFLFRQPLFLCIVGTILFSNYLLGLTVVQYHSRIWFFSESQPPNVSRGEDD